MVYWYGDIFTCTLSAKNLRYATNPRRASMPDRTPKVPTSESPQTEMWELLPFYGKWQTLKKFFATRRAILAPGSAAILSGDKTDRKDFMSPWKFNAFQSVLSAAPALAVLPIILSLRASIERNYDSTVKSLQDRIAGWGNEVLGTLIVPFSLMLTVFLVRRSCLKRKDQNLENRRRAGLLYLYFDGALGLYSQMFASLAYVLWTTADQIPLLGSQAQSLFAGLLYIVSTGLWIWQSLVTIRLVPRRIFSTLGYPPDIGETPCKETEAPWSGFRAAVLLSVPLVIFAMKSLSALGVIAASESVTRLLNRGSL